MRDRRGALARRAALRVLAAVRLARRRRSTGHHRVMVVALTLAGTLSLGGGGEAFDRYQSYVRDLPDPHSLDSRELAQATRIYDRNGVLLYVKHKSGEIRTVVPLSSISPHLVNATIALEDRQFRTHHGIDLRRILGAAIADITHQRVEQGGSTITQQLVKSVFLNSNERSIERKVREATVALEIERRFSKDDILTLYLNRIFYGHEAYGVEAAALTYFAKPAKELDIAEAAMLAAIPNAPSDYDPLNPATAAAARERQGIVLRAMLRDHYVTEVEYAAALTEDLRFQNGAIQKDLKASWFVSYVLQQLERQYGRAVVEAGGLRVITTLNYTLQQIAEESVRNQVNRPDLRARNVNNGATAAIDPATGQVLAMVGSANFYDEAIGGQYNVITESAGRQPGSSFKIYVYATAFSNGYSASSIILDKQGPIDGHPFRNWDYRDEGPITMRQALVESRNIPALLLLKQLGYTRVFTTARLMGLTADLRPEKGIGQAIGATEVTPLEHINAYAVLASGGIYHQPTVILKVTDGDGRVLQEWQPTPGVRVLSPQFAYMITDSLRPVGGGLGIRRPFSATTGTTEDWRDSWFIGYTPELAIGAWMGHTCAGGCPRGTDLLRVVWGAEGAGTIFRDVFNGAYDPSHPVHDFTPPDGLRRVGVCRLSGLRATPECAGAGQAISEWFITGLQPLRIDDWYRGARVCTTDGLLATPDIPDRFAVQKVFLVYPPGYPDDLKDKVIQPMPAQTCGLFTETTSPTLSLSWTTQADGSILVTAFAQDAQAIKEVDFYLDGSASPNRIATQAPYTFTVTGAAGSRHTVTAQAYNFNPSNAPASQTITLQFS